jgi:hypothetical protein
MTNEEELERRRAELKAREGKSGMTANVAKIRARIAELEGPFSTDDPGEVIDLGTFN